MLYQTFLIAFLLILQEHGAVAMGKSSLCQESLAAGRLTHVGGIIIMIYWHGITITSVIMTSAISYVHLALSFHYKL